MPTPKRISRTLPASSPRPLLLSPSRTKALQTKLVPAHRDAPVQTLKSRDARPRRYSTSGVSKTYRSVFPRSFKRDPIVITRAEKHYLISEDGRKIYDASGGAAVSCLGPGPNKKVTKAIVKQLHRVPYVNSNEMTCRIVKRYAEALLATTWGHLVSCVFYSSGKYISESHTRYSLTRCRDCKC
ncbi:unnamed protein product [Periconia digitata]|uniref:Uncharacterized protein n=1 Tax=Periconia digitata TaxID=1303443 RepID=A0A9W4UKS6_9PLEO|nr:unnamed protein product [Periconia digitata]